jgi:hypothetical protein
MLELQRVHCRRARGQLGGDALGNLGGIVDTDAPIGGVAGIDGLTVGSRDNTIGPDSTIGPGYIIDNDISGRDNIIDDDISGRDNTIGRDNISRDNIIDDIIGRSDSLDDHNIDGRGRTVDDDIIDCSDRLIGASSHDSIRTRDRGIDAIGACGDGLGAIPSDLTVFRGGADIALRSHVAVILAHLRDLALGPGLFAGDLGCDASVASLAMIALTTHSLRAWLARPADTTTGNRRCGRRLAPSAPGDRPRCAR